MALLHHATITPSKPELIAAWLPSQRWASGLGDLEPIGGYRFDDPAGEVGLEGILLRSDAGDVVHVPLTYRAAPLAGAEEFLVGTTEHSVLGTRWVYDAIGDPVWRTALAAAVLAGDAGAEQYFEVDGRRETVEPKVRVVGSGSDESADPALVDVVVVRRVGADVASDAVLTGTWADGSGVLAGVRLSD